MNIATKYNVDLILKNTNALSGTPKILMRQAQALSIGKFNVSVISENFHPNLKNNENIECKKTIKWPQSNLNQRKFFNWQAIRKTRGDALVIGHGDSLNQDILFLHTCVHMGKEIAPGPHNDKNLSIPFHQMIFEQGSFKKIVCVSHMMKNDIKKRFNISCPMSVIYPGHDKDLINQVSITEVKKIHEQLHLQENELVVGVIASGNLENRGAFALLRAMSFLEEAERKKIKLLIIGKESKPSKIYDLALLNQMKDRVLWMNPRNDVANLISAVDIAVHAAHIEAAGISFLEILAMSKPVITTKTVGFSEILSDIQKPFIIEKQDPELIAKCLSDLIKDKDLRVKMGEANRKVAAPLTWEKYDEEFMKLIQFHLSEMG